jgi:hypothetical protein
MTASKIVTIHQPNFFPWLGYFNKLAAADLFLVLDNVQFSKTGGTWLNRVRLLVGGEPRWATMPVVRSYHGLRRVGEMKIDDATPWRAKLLKTIEGNYRRAPFFAEVFPRLTELVNDPTDDLAAYNLSAISALAAELGLDPAKFVLGSTLDVEGGATDLLVAMVEAVGGTAYLCGGGAGGYQEDEKFTAAGLELVYQNFTHPVYPQINAAEFAPGLSVIDALMNCGFERTRALVGGAGG